MKAVGQCFCAPAMTWFRLVLVLGLLAGGLGCKPKIGEDCATSIDCSLSGDRLCDITQPGGYCTVFNCEPNLCPDDSVCVAFSEGTCSTPSVSTRFRRTFCMRSCEDEGDCRGGAYHCIDPAGDESRRIVDVNPPSPRICALPSSNSAPPTPPDPAVCFPSDASFDVSRPEAGPPSRDARADAPESSADGIDDGGDSTDVEAGRDNAGSDVLDSSRIETGTDDVNDDVDGPETTYEDAASEPASDMASPDADELSPP